MGPALGSVLAGKYRLIGVLGEGGMGSVYEGVHTGTGKRVAVKVLAGRLAADPEQLRRFELEAQAAALINHPGIVDVLDVGRDESGAPFLVMEHLFGATLRQLERALAPMTPGQVTGLIAPALEALAAAHAAGVIHRDLKPGNIFFSLQPAPALKLLDFGISKFASRGDVTATGVVMGTVAYMAPEQLRSGRRVGPESDLYAIGAVIYGLLAGRPPYVAENDPQLIAEIISAAPTPLAKHRPDLAPALCALVDGLLVKEPERRPASAAALRDALVALAPPDLTGVAEVAGRLAQPYTQLDPSGQPLHATATSSGASTHTALSPATPLPPARPALPTPGSERAAGRASPASAAAAGRRRWWAWSGGAVLLAAAGLAAGFTPQLHALRARLIAWAAGALQEEQARTAVPGAPPEEELLLKPLSSGWRPQAPSRTTPPALHVDRLPDWRPEAVAELGVLVVASRSIDYARGLRDQGRPLEAVAALDGAVELTRAGPDRVVYGHALRIRGDLALDLRRCAEADDLYRRAFQAFEAEGDALGAGLAAQDLGLLGDVCRSSDAEGWFSIALERRRRAKDRPGMFRSANSLGSVRLLFGKVGPAIEAYGQAALTADALGDDRLRVKAQANLATAWAVRAGADVPFEERWTPDRKPASAAWAQAQEHLAAAAGAAQRFGLAAVDLCDGVPPASQSACTRLLADLR